MARIGTFAKKTDRPSSAAEPYKHRNNRRSEPDDWIEVLRWENDDGYVVGVDYYVAPESYREDGTQYTHKEYHVCRGQKPHIEGVGMHGTREQARRHAVDIMRDVSSADEPEEVED